MRGKAFIGIDPGTQGGIALITQKNITVFTLSKLRGEDLKYCLETAFELLECEPVGCLIERVHLYGHEGTKSAKTFMEAYGFLKGLMVGMGIPVEAVAPQKWQKMYPGAGSNKKINLEIALDIGHELTGVRPELAIPPFASFINKENADAVLIAEFYRRTKEGIKKYE